MWSCSAILFTLLCFVHASGDYHLKVVTPDELEPRNPSTRIVGGQPTTIEQWPFTVQVIIYTSPRCGGSIITSTHVLSAAHCFLNIGNELIPVSVMSVRVGSTTIFTGGTVVPVQDVIVHAGYNLQINLNNDNDIALLLLEHELTFSSSVQAVGIPEMGYTVPDDADVTYLGWGATGESAQESRSTILQEVWVKKVNRAVCEQRYKDLQALVDDILPVNVTSNMICAGLLDIGGKDACNSDSGGPLVYNGVLVGIISWAWECGSPIYPGVNTRVSSYTDWIADTIDQLSTDNTTAPEFTTEEPETDVQNTTAPETTPEASETGDVENGGVSIQNSAVLSKTSVLVILVYLLCSNN